MFKAGRGRVAAMTVLCVLVDSWMLRQMPLRQRNSVSVSLETVSYPVLYCFAA